MIALAWVFLGAIGVVSTYLSLTADNDDLVIITGLIGTLAWLLFAFYALDVTIYDQAGTLHTDRYPAMALFGLAMAAPNLYIAITGPLELMSNRERLEREVR